MKLQVIKRSRGTITVEPVYTDLPSITSHSAASFEIFIVAALNAYPGIESIRVYDENSFVEYEREEK